MTNKITTKIEEGLKKAKLYLTTTNWKNITQQEYRYMENMAKRYCIPYDNANDLQEKWESYEDLLQKAAKDCIDFDPIPYDPAGLSQAIEDEMEKQKKGQREIHSDYLATRL